jgi:hypothetical protein
MLRLTGWASVAAPRPTSTAFRMDSKRQKSRDLGAERSTACPCWAVPEAGLPHQDAVGSQSGMAQYHPLLLPKEWLGNVDPSRSAVILQVHPDLNQAEGTFLTIGAFNHTIQIADGDHRHRGGFVFLANDLLQ